MTSFYDRFKIDNIKNNNSFNSKPENSNTINVLKKDYTLNLSDYEKTKINEQYNKLYSNTYDVNKFQESVNENAKIYNLSLKELIEKSSVKYLNLVNDLSNYFNKTEDKSLNKLGYILTKGDNLLYIGLLFLVISFSMWLIDITS